MRVMGWPAFSAKRNPFNSQLYTALQRLGVDVVDHSARQLWRADFDVLHVHWPNFDWPRGALRRGARWWLTMHALAVPAALLWAKARGRQVVWTIHNVQSHDAQFPRLARLYDRFLTYLVDAHISLSEAAREVAVQRFPRLRRLRSFVIPHGHYRHAYPARVDRLCARRELALPETARILLFFGNVRRYKNVPALVRAAAECVGDGVWLVVAGGPFDRMVRDEVRGAAEGARNVRLFLDVIPEDRVHTFFSAADCFINPADTLLNSGSSILALSFGVPVIAPDTPATRDLLRIVGGRFVYSYTGEIRAAVIREAMTSIAAPAATDEIPGLLKPLDWEPIAERTRDAFSVLIAGKHRRAG